MSKIFTEQQAPQLVAANLQFAGTGGVSEGNGHAHFIPAFQDAGNGQVELSCYRDGRLASFHLLDGLPEEWITQRDINGRVVKIKDTVVSGFVRLGLFFTRQEAAEFIDQLSLQAG